MKRIVVVGGGISGLAAAYRLKDRAEVTLLEAGDRLGGVIRSTCRNGYLMEGGPDSFLNKLGIVDLCRELGLEGELIPTNKEHPRSFVVRGRAMYPPEGFYLLAPNSLGSLARSPLLSPLGKARVALDLVLPRGRRQPDETLGSFVRRRFGSEALARIAQPLTGGIYTADPDRLSLAATQPQFLEMEREQRSVILALRKRRRQTGAVSGARYAQFLTFRQGMQTLVEALAAALPDVRLGTNVVELRPINAGSSAGQATTAGDSSPDWERHGAGQPEAGARPTFTADPPGENSSPDWERQGEGQPRSASGWLLKLATGESIEADAVCLCLPAPEAFRLAPGLPELGRTPYASSATISFGFRREQVRHPLDGMGLVIPDAERRSIIACTFSSQKFPGRAPEGRVLLRAFAGGELARERYEASDEALVSSALRDLNELLGIDGEPEECLISRCPESMPQYQLGHLERLAALEAKLQGLPGLALAGNGYRGVGVPDCIAGGFAAADRLLAAAG